MILQFQTKEAVEEAIEQLYYQRFCAISWRACVTMTRFVGDWREREREWGAIPTALKFKRDPTLGSESDFYGWMEELIKAEFVEHLGHDVYVPGKLCQFLNCPG